MKSIAREAGAVILAKYYPIHYYKVDVPFNQAFHYISLASTEVPHLFSLKISVLDMQIFVHTILEGVNVRKLILFDRHFLDKRNKTEIFKMQ